MHICCLGKPLATVRNFTGRISKKRDLYAKDFFYNLRAVHIGRLRVVFLAANIR